MDLSFKDWFDTTNLYSKLSLSSQFKSSVFVYLKLFLLLCKSVKESLVAVLQPNHFYLNWLSWRKTLIVKSNKTHEPHNGNTRKNSFKHTRRRTQNLYFKLSGSLPWKQLLGRRVMILLEALCRKFPLTKAHRILCPHLGVFWKKYWATVGEKQVSKHL